MPIHVYELLHVGAQEIGIALEEIIKNRTADKKTSYLSAISLHFMKESEYNLTSMVTVY